MSMVLDGTTVLDLADFDLESTDFESLPGQYRSEQGGSVLFLTVRSQSTGEWIVERTYSEPKFADASARYAVRRTRFGLADADSQFLLQITREGLLAFEQDSGVDSIPASYWIHYTRDAMKNDDARAAQ
ncbi:MAG: hypothetical protein AAFN78_13165 [Pseudomonadota bacterium]